MRRITFSTLLWLFAFACAGASVLVLAFAFRNLPRERLAEPAGDLITTDGESAQTPAEPPLASFAAAFSKDLRRPLYDPPPAAAPRSAATSKPAALGVTLAGTILDPLRPQALFVTTGGKTELKAVGEKTGGAEVLAIERESATLLHNGRKVTLRVPAREVQ